MELKDKSGKTILDTEEFNKLYCQHCHEYDECPRDLKKMLGCRAFVETGLWDKFYRKN